eukprot:CAMPEP_0117047440 /NCGR_PEP_ID=MMETSP0472-20121206/32785_1 /TAXON_ID=693140 ORGANISM="Tiarina fusus, Strain LIS" /NCGR_SAMPLE_ID=MMETSP0472 /ASSEMBLY_ACC=CAM_ASM_000603 /LENGTH=89 /DNA_ID=CAMNT_0004760141 /DNA_START=3 /DNA_END=268 /DNA_ORIENTATION=-
MKKGDGLRNERPNSKKLKRRNSISNHHAIAHGMLPPKTKSENSSPFPGIRFHSTNEIAIEQLNESAIQDKSTFKRKKVKLKEQFSGIFG